MAGPVNESLQQLGMRDTALGDGKSAHVGGANGSGCRRVVANFGGGDMRELAGDGSGEFPALLFGRLASRAPCMKD